MDLTVLGHIIYYVVRKKIFSKNKKNIFTLK